MGSSLQYIACLFVKCVFVFTGICITHRPPGRLPIKQVAGRKGDKDREERLHARANQEHLTRQLELELFLSL